MPSSCAGGRLLPLLLLLSATASQILSSTVAEDQTASQSNYRETKPNKFVSVNVACTKSTLMVVATMNDPFHGLVYARGFPQSCRTISEGQRRVKLKVNVEDCGVKVVEDENETTHYEMMVYVQYDRHVQQAIDEQVLVQCNPDERIVVKASMSQPRGDPEVKVTTRPSPPLVKAARLEDSDEFSVGYNVGFGGHPADSRDDASSAPAARRQSTGTVGTISAERHTADADSVFSEDQELVEERRREEQKPEVARCWLDILKGDGLQGDAFFESLNVGDATTMLIKTRINEDSGPGPMDVMVTNCSAHDGSLTRSQQLIDEDGCTIDPGIMSPVIEHPQHGAGHRLHYSTFNAFKFPERSSLHLRCTVLVCRGQCPRRHCRSQRLTRAARLGLGMVRPISDAELRSAGRYPITRLLRTLQMEIKDGSTIVERIEVFNSAEVQAPGIESVPTRPRSKEPTERAERPHAGHDSFFSDGRLMCMTSSRLLLSFGILLAVLVVSVLVALLLCVKQRQQTRKLRSLQTFQRMGTPAPTPHYYRVGPL